jgi:membrane-associated phospholipid phosphatase
VRRAAIELVAGLIAFVLIGWGLGELWVRVGDSADMNAISTVADWRPQGVVDVAKVVTWLGSSAVLIPLGAVACFMFWRAGRPRDAAAIVLSLGGAIALWHIVKPLVGRSRPPVEHLASVSGTSFPSGHATQAAAFWFALALALRSTWGWVGAAVIVVVVCASRVILGVHYPGDVVAGALLGGGWAVFTRWTVLKAAP